MTYRLTIEGQTFDVDIQEVSGAVARVSVNGASCEVNIENTPDIAPQSPPFAPAQQISPQPIVSFPAPSAPKTGLKAGAVTQTGMVLAPMPGLIIKINVTVGDSVAAGQCVVVMEAMKMENDIPAPVSGTVSEIRVQKGADVSTGEVLLVIA